MIDKQLLPILKIHPGDISPYVIVCGDPGRAKEIADKMDEAVELAYNREYRVFTGKYRGQHISVASHGVGAAGAAVCFEELIKAGARVLVRVGTAGSLNQGIRDGDLVVATAAVREDGVTDQLVPLSFPAVADSTVTDALYAAAKEHGARVGKGIVLSLGAFYPGVLPLPNPLMSKAGAIAVEMEISALYIVASLRGVKAGAIAAIDGMAIEFDADAYDPNRDLVKEAIAKEITIALEAMACLAEKDYANQDV